MSPRLSPPHSAVPIDVIIPVYGAAAELAACLASLLRHTDLACHRLVLVIDGPQEPEVEAVLAIVAERPEEQVLILRNPARRGFVGSVNRGMGVSDRDVVLLNSDTEVTAGWLEKLREAAYSHPAIATVTPFSNNATIASLPRFAEVNALPAGWSADRFAALVERVAARERPRLPTGVGVCLYIKRKALDRLGLFDEARFGLGYGEESEFCFRALKAGFLNVLDDATFIYHAGQRSFGASRSGAGEGGPPRHASGSTRSTCRPWRASCARTRCGRRASGCIAGLKRAERGGRPPQPPRDRGGSSTWCTAGRRGAPAGTEVYARRLALRQAAWREVTVYARMADPGARARGGPGDLRRRRPRAAGGEQLHAARSAVAQRPLRPAARRRLPRRCSRRCGRTSSTSTTSPGTPRPCPALRGAAADPDPLPDPGLVGPLRPGQPARRRAAALLRPGAGQVLGLPAADRAAPGRPAQPRSSTPAAAAADPAAPSATRTPS